MNHIAENNEIVYRIDGPDPFQPGKTKTFGIMKSQTERIAKRGRYVLIAHLIQIVEPGLILAKHIFRGLKRPLLYENDEHGDRDKLVFSWKPPFDYDFDYGKRFDLDGMTRRDAPIDKVFVVLATPNKVKDKYPSIDYWLEHWTWIDEDDSLDAAPTGWETRYDEKIER